MKEFRIFLHLQKGSLQKLESGLHDSQHWYNRPTRSRKVGDMGGIFHGAGGLPAVQPKAVEPRTINQRRRDRRQGLGLAPAAPTATHSWLWRRNCGAEAGFMPTETFFSLGSGVPADLVICGRSKSSRFNRLTQKSRGNIQSTVTPQAPVFLHSRPEHITYY